MYRFFALLGLFYSTAIYSADLLNSVRLCEQGRAPQCGEAATAYLDSNQISQAKKYAKQGCRSGDASACMADLALQFDKPYLARMKAYCQAGSLGACREYMRSRHNSTELSQFGEELKSYCYDENDAACSVWQEYRLQSASQQDRDNALQGCKNKDVKACYDALDILNWDELEPLLPIACGLRIDDACARIIGHTDTPLTEKQKSRAKAFCTKGIKPMCKKVYSELPEAKRLRLMSNACDNNPKMCAFTARVLLDDAQYEPALETFKKACNENAPVSCYYQTAMATSNFDASRYDSLLAKACDFTRSAADPVCEQYLNLRACREGEYARCNKLTEHLLRIGNAKAGLNYPKSVCQSTPNPKKCLDQAQLN